MGKVIICRTVTIKQEVELDCYIDDQSKVMTSDEAVTYEQNLSLGAKLQAFTEAIEFSPASTIVMTEDISYRED